MVTPLGERMLRDREIEHERIQSEIRRNNAETKKMEAEATPFYSYLKYITTVVVSAFLLWSFTIDTVKTLFDITSSQIKENKVILRKISHENEKLKSDKDNLEKRSRELEKKVEESSNLLKIAEKRYLEIMMLSATANAYNTYVQLVKRQEIYLPQGAAAQKKAEKAYFQACQYLHDYWNLVVTIAEQTQADLFPQVKQEISDRLQKGEQENVFSEECRAEDGQQLLSPIQRKSLDLIERHVRRIRAGGSRFPDDLITTFIDQREFR